MIRLPRTGLLLAHASRLALLASAWLGPWSGAVFASQQSSDPAARFSQQFAALRRGEDIDRSELAELGAQLALRGRPDARDLVTFYTRLEPAELRAGSAAQSDCEALFRRVTQARDDNLRAAAWDAERLEIEDQLWTLVERTAGAADPAPAAYAHSLLAQLAIAEILGNRALDTGQVLERLALAEDSLASARAIYERVGMRTPQLDLLLSEARIALFRGQLAEAQSGFERALQQAEALSRSDREEFALLGLLNVADGLGDVARQDQLLIRIAAVTPPAESFALARQCALRLWNEDLPEAAFELLQRYPPTALGAQAAPEDLASYELLCGMIARRLGDLQAARGHLRAAEALDVASLAEFSKLAAARLALDEGHPETALEIVATARPRRVRNQLEACAIEAEAALALDDPQRAIRALAPALELADAEDRAQALEALEADLVRSVLGEHVGLSTIALAAEAQLRIGAPLEALRIALDYQARPLREGVRARESVEERLRSTLRGEPALRIEQADVLAWAADSDLGLVTWIVGADASLAFWARPDGTTTGQRLELGRSAMRLAARRMREALCSPQVPNPATRERSDQLGAEILASLLPDELLATLERQARDSADPQVAPSILFVLPGALAELPLEACRAPRTRATRATLTGDADPVPAAGVRLEHLCRIRTLPGLPAARPGAPAGDLARRGWFFGGAPRSGAAPRESAPAVAPAVALALTATAERDQDSWAELAGARRELDQTAALYPEAWLAVGADFDRSALESALDSGRNLHLATHLVPSERCSGRRFAAEGLALAGGDVLCPEDIALGELRTELAVLSACGSAGGRFVDGDGLRGLAQAFLEVGTRNLVVTLWPVEDAAAESFGRELHNALLRGAPPSGAVRAARAALVAEGRAAADWAAFRFIGRD